MTEKKPTLATLGYVHGSNGTPPQSDDPEYLRVYKWAAWVKKHGLNDFQVFS